MAWKIDGQYFENCSCDLPGEELTIARATKSKLSAFGIDFAYEGGSAFAHPFSWAA